MRFRNLRSVHIAFFAALVLVSSCTFDRLEELDPPPPVEFCDSSMVTFENGVRQILELNCANANFNPNGGCHQAGSAIVDYTLYGGVRLKVDQDLLQLRALEQKNMPPSYSTGPRPDSTQLKLLQCWIDAGAPEK